jgi:hypothetical protein
LEITHVLIEGGVTSIGSSAFGDCRSLFDVQIGSDVKKIGNGAFRLCTELSSIYIPKNVEQIGLTLFSYSGIKSIEVDPANPFYSSENGILFNKAKTKIECFPQEFGGDDYTVPSYVTSIGNYGFFPTFLLSIVIPGNVTSI